MYFDKTQVLMAEHDSIMQILAGNDYDDDLLASVRGVLVMTEVLLQMRDGD